MPLGLMWSQPYLDTHLATALDPLGRLIGTSTCSPRGGEAGATCGAAAALRIVNS
jgi:hypothetical protein